MAGRVSACLVNNRFAKHRP